MQDVREELTCPICMDLFSEPRRLPCGHVYCRGCLQDMLMKKYLNSRTSERVLSCPECRQHYNLTLQVAGVDIFPRDFKLMRLVELCKRASGGSRRASDDEDETAVKTVCPASESEATTTTTSTTSTSLSASADQSGYADRVGHSQAPNSLTREQLEAGLVTFGTPASSLSDDSWIYVQGRDLGSWSGRALNLGPSLDNLGHRAPVRGDDSWLLPSNDFRFPVGGGSDFHGYFRDGEPSSLNSDVNLSGRFDNVGLVDSQRYALNETVTPHPVGRPTAHQVETSESSSETDTESDDRADEERSGDDDRSDDGQRQRRSRLSRFFRSLVMSDSDSWDEEDGHGSLGTLGGSFQPTQLSYCDHPPLPAQGLSSQHCEFPPSNPVQGLPFQGRPPQGDSPACLAPSEHLERFHDRYLGPLNQYHSYPRQMHVFSEPNLRLVRNAGAPLPSSGSQMFHVRAEVIPNPAIDRRALVFEGQSSLLSEGNPRLSGPVLRLSESPAVLPSLAEGHARSADPADIPAGQEGQSENNKSCNSNHNSVPEVDLGQGAAAVLAVADAAGGSEAASNASQVTATFGASRRTTEGSDDSGDDYEAQTSMLHPRRKPRSRLKKFFTSLLSLSSSEDEDDNEVSGQIKHSATSAPAASLSHQ